MSRTKNTGRAGASSLKTANYSLENLLAVIFAGITAFFFTIQSPVHLWNFAATGTDSSVFKTVAMMMERGSMPYTETFDHKGPLLYILNWLGNQISSYRGIWVIEMIFLTVCLFMIYKTCRLVCGKGASCIVTFLSVTLLFSYYDGGNCSEEYAMTFISIGAFILIDYFRNRKITILRYMICGACLGCALMLRPNMIALWIVMCIAVLVRHILDRTWKQLGLAVLWFLIGFLIVLLPVMIWLGVHHALVPCWNSYILFNLHYASEGVGIAVFSDKWATFFSFFNTTVFIAAIASLAFVSAVKDRFLNISYLIYLVFNLLLICLSGMAYRHYGMIIVPAVAYPLALIFEQIGELERKMARVLTILVSLLVLCTLIAPQWLELMGTVAAVCEPEDSEQQPMVEETIADLVRAYTEEEDVISVYGNWDIIYVLSKRGHATRFSYQVPIGQVDPAIMEEYLTELAQELPPVIVVQDGQYDETISSFLEEHSYSLIWAQYGEDSGAQIYLSEEAAGHGRK